MSTMQQVTSRPACHEANHIAIKHIDALLSAKTGVLEQDAEQDFTLGTEVSQPAWEGSQPSCGSSDYLEEFTEEMVRMLHSWSRHTCFAQPMCCCPPSFAAVTTVTFSAKHEGHHQTKLTRLKQTAPLQATHMLLSSLWTLTSASAPSLALRLVHDGRVCLFCLSAAAAECCWCNSLPSH
jgi:hypothetical protein